jgi:membrane protease YdiL (CAAX protease family)
MSETDAAPRASIGVAAAAWLAGLVGATLAVALVLAFSGHTGEGPSDYPFSITAIATVAQWVPIVLVLWFVSRQYLSGHFARDYALRFRVNDLWGIPIGIASQLVLVPLLYWPLRELFSGTFSDREVKKPGRELTERADGFWKCVLLLVVVVGAPLVEEMLYRGLLLRALDGVLARPLALLASAAWFALAHLQAVQFVGLFAFGIVLGLCLQRTGRLGMSIVAHAAFNTASLLLFWSEQ